MKKTMVLLAIFSVLSVFLWGCASVPLSTGHTSGGLIKVPEPLLSKSLPELKILNIELPPEIKGGDKIPVKIIYEEAGSPVESIYIRTMTRRGSTNYILKASRLSKTGGVIELFMPTRRNTPTGIDILISIFLKDGGGNKSNTISKWVTIK